MKVPCFVAVVSHGSNGGTSDKLRLTKPKPLIALVKASCNVERLPMDCIHGAESWKRERLDSDQVGVSSAKGVVN